MNLQTTYAVVKHVPRYSLRFQDILMLLRICLKMKRNYWTILREILMMMTMKKKRKKRKRHQHRHNLAFHQHLMQDKLQSLINNICNWDYWKLLRAGLKTCPKRVKSWLQKMWEPLWISSRNFCNHLTTQGR